jgi:Fe-S-cluster containining protein
VIRLPQARVASPDAIEVHHNCARCTAYCCHYVSTEIDPPTTARDIDIIRWYLMHPGVRVYVDAESCWFLQFASTCRYLGDDGLCGIYETRPQICRDLQPTGCEFALGPGDLHYFTCLEEFDQWYDERQRLRRERSRKRNRGVARNGRRSVEG